MVWQTMATGGGSDDEGLTEQQKKDGEKANITIDQVCRNASEISIAGSNNTIIGTLVMKMNRPPPGLRQRLREKRREEPVSEELDNILDECDAFIADAEEGCVKLTLAFKTLKGLNKFWKMYTSGELQERLRREAPMCEVHISTEDYRKLCIAVEDKRRKSETVTEKLTVLELAAKKFIKARAGTIKILEDLTERIERDAARRDNVAVAGGLLTAGLIIGAIAGVPFSGGASLTLLTGVAVATLTGAYVLAGIIIPMMNNWSETANAQEVVLTDCRARRRFVRALNEVLSAWSELKALDLPEGSSPHVYKLESSFRRLYDVASDPTMCDFEGDPKATLIISGIPEDFDKVITPAIIFQRKKIRDVVSAIKNVRGIMDLSTKVKFDTLVNEIKKDLLN